MAALVAVTAGAMLAPELAAAPPPKTDFVITTNEDIEYWGTDGAWASKGALKESGGHATCPFGSPLHLVHPSGSVQGEMVINCDSHEGTFAIVQATEEYAHLGGATGLYQDHWHWQEIGSTGQYTGMVRRKLEGSVP